MEQLYIIVLLNLLIPCMSLSIVCPSGYQYNGAGCVRPNLCPNNFVQNGSMCFPSVQIACPSSYFIQINLTQYATLPNVIEPRILNVTDPYSPPPIPPAINCKEKFEWDGDQCVQVNRIDIVCPYQHNYIDGQCQHSVDGSCPSKYHLVNQECVREMVDDVQCPKGFWKDVNNCVHSMPSCPEGYKLENSICVKSILGYCSPDSEMVNGVCIRRHLTGIECPVGYTWNGKQCIHHTASCDEGYDLINDKCVRSVYINATFSCTPPRIFSENNTCISTEQYCQAGYILRDGKCFENGTVCMVGYALVDGQCVKDKCLQQPPTIPPFPVPTCPDGHYPWPNNNCTFNETAPPYCPEGYILRDYRCIRIGFGSNTTQPRCPSGYIFDGYRCIQTTNIPSVLPPSCPVGYTFQINQCVKVTIQPPNTDIPVEPINPCPTGYNWCNGTCIKTVPTCPTGFVFNRDACYPKPTQYPNPDIYTSTPRPTYWEAKPSYFPPTTCNQTCTDSSNCPSICEISTKGHGGTINISNVINNNNTVYHPTNITTINENHVVVHMNQGETGEWSVKVFKQNDSITDDQVTGIDLDQSMNSTDNLPEWNGDDENKQKCCEVHSPRQCKQEGDEWVCYHKKYNRCGEFCTQSQIYLKPQQTLYRSNVLVMVPPSPKYIRMRSYRTQSNKSTDCSGCIQGAYSCSANCYKYDCHPSNCRFIDQMNFCQIYGGDGCTREDGFY